MSSTKLKTHKFPEIPYSLVEKIITPNSVRERQRKATTVGHSELTFVGFRTSTQPTRLFPLKFCKKNQYSDTKKRWAMPIRQIFRKN